MIPKIFYKCERCTQRRIAVHFCAIKRVSLIPTPTQIHRQICYNHKMKNIQSIISNLRRSSLKRLNSNAIINKLLLTLPKDLQKSILFGTLKGDTLFIATANKGVCAEINNFRAIDLLNAINFMCESAESIVDSGESRANPTNLSDDLALLRKIKKIKAYIPQNILEILDKKSAQKGDEFIIERYKERAVGTFHISENSPFKEIFSAIKDAIKRNADESKRAN